MMFVAHPSTLGNSVKKLFGKIGGHQDVKKKTDIHLEKFLTDIIAGSGAMKTTDERSESSQW